MVKETGAGSWRADGEMGWEVPAGGRAGEERV